MNRITTTEEQREVRINVRVKGPIAAHLESVIGPNGSYENQSEYIRDLIRHDMAEHAPYDLRSGLLEGYAQLAKGDIHEQTPMNEIIEIAERQMREEENG